MAAFTSLAIGAIAVGTGISAYSQHRAAQAQSQYQSQVASQQAKIEKAKRQQMELDATRRQREIIRQQQRARSAALANATSQGAQQGSGLFGGYGQIGGQTGVNLLGVQQNLELGRNIFDANAAITSASARYASTAGNLGSLAAFGGGLSSLGNAYMANLGAIDRLGQYYGQGAGGSTDAGGLYDPWQGLRQGQYGG